MNKKISIKFTYPQLLTIEEALDMLATDYCGKDTPVSRKVQKNIERVRDVIDRGWRCGSI